MLKIGKWLSKPHFDVKKASLAGYYKPMKMNDLIEEQQKADLKSADDDKAAIFRQSSWTFGRREWLVYDNQKFIQIF